MNNTVNYIQHKIHEKQLKEGTLIPQKDLDELLINQTNMLVSFNNPLSMERLAILLFTKANSMGVKLEDLLINYIK